MSPAPFRMSKTAQKAPADPAVVFNFDAPDMGFAYQLERVLLSGDVDETDTLEVYLGNESPGNLVGVASGQNVIDLNQPIYVPAGKPVTALLKGVPANTPFTLTVYGYRGRE